jgi:hypothetical protein
MVKRKIRTIKRNRFSVIFPILTIIGAAFISVMASTYEKSWTYNWEGIREQIKDTVKIAQYRGISTGVISIDARKSNQFDRRVWLMKHATVDELLKLTEYPNGTVKTIAYEGLIRKTEFEDKYDIVIKAISDIEYDIELLSGCEGARMSIGEYLVNYILGISNKPLLLNGMRNRFGFSEKQIETIIDKLKKTKTHY